MKKKKRKFNFCLFLSLIAGGVVGYCGSAYIDTHFRNTGDIFSIFFTIVLLVLSFFIQIIIHEAGHLVFGLLSGYEFSSFRIFQFMFLKDEEKMKCKRLSIAGTGGQCLMVPPELVNGRIPVILYNLGGSILNLLTALLFFLVFLVVPKSTYLSEAMCLFAIVGFFLAIMNGIPMHAGNVDNDGYNALSLSRDSTALRSFWIQLKVSEQLSKGKRLKEMPEEWFHFPTDEELKNSMHAVIGVFHCNRLMDQHLFEEASQQIEHLLSLDSGIIGIHRNLLICDQIFCELIGQNRPDIVLKLYTKELGKFMKSMKNFPSVLRTKYAYSLLHEHQTEKAATIKKRFEKCAKKYPYQSDIASEWELIHYAEKKQEI